jgi:hypothetical protein
MLGEAPRTLSEKVWDAHVVRAADGEPDLLYIDLHLLHEVTSPQATTHRPTTSSRSLTRSAARRSRRCVRTAPISAYGCTRSAMPNKASCT